MYTAIFFILLSVQIILYLLILTAYIACSKLNQASKIFFKKQFGSTWQWNYFMDMTSFTIFDKEQTNFLGIKTMLE